MEKTYLFKSISERFKRNRKGFFRIWLVMVIIYIVSLFLGYAVFLIVFGIQFAVMRIVIHWIPARNWFARTFDYKFVEYDSSKTSPTYKLLVNVFLFTITLFYIAMGFYIIKLGVGFISRDGFLGQNFIYLLFFR